METIRAHLEPHAGRNLGELREERRQEHELHVVAREKHEAPLARPWLEARRGKRTLERGEPLPHERRERERPRRRLETVGLSAEQRVVEQAAELRVAVAHRRLRDADAPRGPRDAPLAKQRVERHEQVQVDGADIHD